MADGVEGQAGSVAAEDMPTIRILGGQLSQNASDAERHLFAANVGIFQRSGALVRPVSVVVPASGGRNTTTAALREVTDAYLRDQLCRRIRWEVYRRREKNWFAVDPPKDVAATILARVGEWTFRDVAGVISTPTLRPDGTILSKAGYDIITKLVLVNPPDLPSILDYPSREDAIEALTVLGDLLKEFPFVDDESHSVGLSALITPVVRSAYNVVPVHVTRAPTPGTGKSYLFDVASAIAIGQLCHVISSADGDEKEMEKRLGACFLAGYPITSIDNVNGELGGDFLCQAVERPLVSPRILGRSEQPILPNRMTLFATGNNIRLKGDMARRALIASLDARVEQPELRVFKDNPVARVLADRGRYIAAALTVVRAYIAAGSPNPPKPLASYEAWSTGIRGALIWLGRADPVATIAVARADDPDLESLGSMLDAWAAKFGTGIDTAKTARQLIDGTKSDDALGEAMATLHTISNAKLPHEKAAALGYWLRAKKGRIVGDLSFNTVSHESKHKGAAQWYVVVK